MRLGDFVQASFDGTWDRGVVVGMREGEMGVMWLVHLQDRSDSRAWFFEQELEVVEMEPSDVVRSTLCHVRRVGTLLAGFAANLVQRAVDHDRSKFSSDELPAFIEATPKLAGLTYGSDEYKAALASIRLAIQNHYQMNGHHPEHWENGVDGMSLLDLVEMLADWKAAGERHADGSIEKSIEHNRERFRIGPQLESILRNTVKEMRLGDVVPGG